MSDHGNRIAQLEDHHRTTNERVVAVDRRVTGIEATLSSMIAEAASSRATMTAKMDGLALTLDNVKSTLDIEAGRRLERSDLTRNQGWWRPIVLSITLAAAVAAIGAAGALWVESIARETAPPVVRHTGSVEMTSPE